MPDFRPSSSSSTASLAAAEYYSVRSSFSQSEDLEVLLDPVSTSPDTPGARARSLSVGDASQTVSLALERSASESLARVDSSGYGSAALPFSVGSSDSEDDSELNGCSSLYEVIMESLEDARFEKMSQLRERFQDEAMREFAYLAVDVLSEPDADHVVSVLTQKALDRAIAAVPCSPEVYEAFRREVNADLSRK